MKIKIVLIADTHGHTPELPEGDVLVHAGDGTMMGTEAQVKELDDWFGTLPFRYIIYIPGNHDFLFEDTGLPKELLRNAIVLINRTLAIDEVKFWGSPYTPTFGSWAFMKAENELEVIWGYAPGDTDVLITHGPPKGILDSSISGNNVGSQSLLDRTRAIKPKVHVFGHIHETYGEVYNCGVRYVNASVVNEYYQNVNKPVVVEV